MRHSCMHGRATLLTVLAICVTLQGGAHAQDDLARQGDGLGVRVPERRASDVGSCRPPPITTPGLPCVPQEAPVLAPLPDLPDLSSDLFRAWSGTPPQDLGTLQDALVSAQTRAHHRPPEDPRDAEYLHLVGDAHIAIEYYWTEVCSVAPAGSPACQRMRESRRLAMFTYGTVLQSYPSYAQSAQVVLSLAMGAERDGQAQHARQLYARLADRHREAENAERANVRAADLALQAGDLTDARSRFARAARIADPVWSAYAFHRLGEISERSGAVREAARRYGRSIRRLRSEGGSAAACEIERSAIARAALARSRFSPVGSVTDFVTRSARYEAHVRAALHPVLAYYLADGRLADARALVSAGLRASPSLRCEWMALLRLVTTSGGRAQTR